MKSFGISFVAALAMVAGSAFAENTPPTPKEPVGDDPPGWECDFVGEKIVCVPADDKEQR